MPAETELDAARDKMGVDKFVLSESDRTILKKAGVTIDLGGLGKGFTADDIARWLQEQE